MRDFGRWFEETAEYLRQETPEAREAECEECDGEGVVETSAYDADYCHRCGGRGYYYRSQLDGIGPDGHVLMHAKKVDCVLCLFRGRKP